MAQYQSVLNPMMPGATTTGAAPGNMNNIVNQAIPGFSNLTTQATGIVGNLMGGLPSAAPTQRANAYFGASSGMPGSDFVRNRGFDLYGERAEQSRQRGLDDFLKLLSGYTPMVTQESGQAHATAQAAANRTFQEQQQAKANKQAMEMQQDAAENRNYWDPRWRNRGTSPMPGRYPTTQISPY